MRNWLRRRTFSVCIPYPTDETCLSGVFCCPLRGIDVQVLHVGQLRALFHPQSRHDRDLLIAFAQHRHLTAVDPRRRGSGHVEVGDSRRVRAVGVGFELDGEDVLPPVVADALGVRGGAQDVFHLLRLLAQRGHVAAGDADFDRHRDGLARVELPHVDPRARDPLVQRLLQGAEQVVGVMLVVDLDDDLRVVELLQLGRDREPEARAAAPDEGGQGFQDLTRLTILTGVLLAVFLGHLAHHFLRTPRGFAGGRKRRVFRQPHVKV